jgi:hypothetical protein
VNLRCVIRATMDGEASTQRKGHKLNFNFMCNEECVWPVYHDL